MQHPIPDITLHRDHGLIIWLFNMLPSGVRWSIVTPEIVHNFLHYREQASGILPDGTHEQAIERADYFIGLLGYGQHSEQHSQGIATRYPIKPPKRKRQPHKTAPLERAQRGQGMKYTRADMERMRAKYWSADGKLIAGEGTDRQSDHHEQ